MLLQVTLMLLPLVGRDSVENHLFYAYMTKSYWISPLPRSKLNLPHNKDQ